MKFISTHHDAKPVDFKEALMHGLAPDGGLYIPEKFPPIDHHLLKNLAEASIFELGDKIMGNFLPEIPAHSLNAMIHHTLSFPIPLHPLEKDVFLLEVFHGPTLSFKDVGARFMSQALSYYLQQQNKQLIIMVATSGDTGSAIANAFHNTPNIHVYVLYPSKKITLLQEQQMTTLGNNIHALEVEGTFDDCQKLVKQALLDKDIRAHHDLTTANSINIARLLPQMIYHSWGICQLQRNHSLSDPVLVVPSGNLGNLTAAIYAKAIGFPIHHFLAATNVNSVFPRYVNSGKFTPEPSKQSLSNAMDVGNPSNFARVLAFYHNSHQKLTQAVKSISISDDETLTEIRRVYDTTGYIMDPHTAVGMAASKNARDGNPIIITATAHPAKFPEVIKKALGFDIELPERLAATLHKPKLSTKIPADFEGLKNILLRTAVSH